MTKQMMTLQKVGTALEEAGYTWAGDESGLYLMTTDANGRMTSYRVGDSKASYAKRAREYAADTRFFRDKAFKTFGCAGCETAAQAEADRMGRFFAQAAHVIEQALVA